MTCQARYSLSTGEVVSYLQGMGITDTGQIASQKTAGFGFVAAPDEAFGQQGIVDLATGAFSLYRAPIPVPDLLSQYVAAQINAGNLDPSAFHPNTIANLNIALSAVGMTAITAAASGTAAASSTP